MENISGYRWERINMVAKCIVHMYITAELKPTGFLVNVTVTNFKLYTHVFIILYTYTITVLSHIYIFLHLGAIFYLLHLCLNNTWHVELHTLNFVQLLIHIYTYVYTVLHQFDKHLNFSSHISSFMITSITLKILIKETSDFIHMCIYLLCMGKCSYGSMCEIFHSSQPLLFHIYVINC